MTKYDDKENFKKHITLNMRHARKCRKGHENIDSKLNLRSKHGECIACKYGMPDGPYIEVFENVDLFQYEILTKYKDDEERRVAHIKRVIEWRKKHKDKTKEWQANYDNKPEIKSARKAKDHESHLAKKATLTEEDIIARRKHDKELRDARKDRQQVRIAMDKSPETIFTPVETNITLNGWLTKFKKIISIIKEKE